MSQARPRWSGAYTLLLLLGIFGVIVSVPVALMAALWLPVTWEIDRIAAIVSIAFIAAPAVQIALLRRADDLNRAGQGAPAKLLIAVQVLAVLLVAAWMTSL